MANIYDVNGDVIDTGTADLEEPSYHDIPIVALTVEGGLPKSKDAGTVPAKIYYRSVGESFTAYATLKVQGSSSATTYPKKNYTIKLFTDEAMKDKKKVGFLDWKASNKYVMKANWVDHTHARNIVNARLWSKIMKSRSDYSTLPETLRKSPLAVDGFPIKVYGNGIYQGLYTMNLPKDALYGLSDKIANQVLLEADSKGAVNSDPVRFRAASDEYENWHDETHDEMTADTKAAWDRVLNFVYTSSNAEFVANLDSYIDKQSMIDAYIFLYTACVVDNLNNNQFFYTYDLSKWYAGMYDLDGTWGNPCFIPSKSDWYAYNTAFQSGYTVCNGGGATNLLYERLGNLFTAEIRSRYEELRASVLSADNIVAMFDEFMISIPPYLYEEDYASTTAGGDYINIPLKTENNIIQVRQFVHDRLAYVDSMILV